MALVGREMNRAKTIARSVSSFYAEIEPNFILRLKEKQRPPYGDRNFEQLWLDFPELGVYFPRPETLNYLLMALVCREMEKGKTIARSVSNFQAEI